LPMRRTAAVFAVGLSPIDLGLEGAGHGLTVGIDTEELFDAPLGAIEPALRNTRQPDPLLEQTKGSFERQVATLQLLDDVTESANGIFEGDFGNPRTGIVSRGVRLLGERLG